MTIPSSVTNVSSTSFSDCALNEFQVDADNKYYKAEDRLLLTKDGQTLVAGVAGHVVIPDGVTNIADQAFSASYQSYSGLLSVTMPSSLLNVGEFAFRNCAKLTDIIIPEGVTDIGRYAFQGCNGVTNVVIASTVKSIGEEAFSGCFERVDEGVVIFDGCVLGVNGACPTTVSLPKGIRLIASTAFDGCGELMDVTIPDSVSSIGQDAFVDCSQLTNITVDAGNSFYSSVDGVLFSKDRSVLICYPSGRKGPYYIPETTREIAENAFYNCQGLTGINIPNGVTDVGQCAFRGSGNLTHVILPPSVSSVGWGAFYDCAGLTDVAVPSGVTGLGPYTFKNCNQIRSATVPTSVCGIDFSLVTNLVISEGTKIIDDGAFKGCAKLTSLTIPSTVTSIGYEAFCGCSGLRSVVIPQSVTSIGNRAFASCTGLAHVSLLSSEETYFYDSSSYSRSGTFYGCSGIRSVALGQGACNSSMLYVFPSSCSMITNVVVVDGVTRIGGWFGSSLTGLEIPQSVTNINGSAFSSCSKLGTGLVIVDDCVLFMNGNCPSSVELPEGVRLIADNAFRSASLESIAIPDTVAHVGSKSFVDCPNLKEITVDEGNPVFRSVDGVLYSRDRSTLACCPSGRSGIYEIPAGTKTIGDYAFYKCVGLTSVTIQEGVTSVGDYAFAGCVGLTSLPLPATVRNIGQWAFSDCSGLKSLSIPEGVQCVGNYMFYRCGELTNVSVPESVTSIGTSAFNGCSKLTNVTISENVTNIGDSAFNGCAGLASVIIPDGVTSIGNRTFYNCKGLTQVSIPIGVTNIGTYAFYYCRKLTSLTIPDGVETIGEYAFYYCEGIERLSIPSSVTNIGSRAFAGYASGLRPKDVTLPGWNCGLLFTYVTNLVISAGTSYIRASAFSGSSALRTVTIPEGVETIGSSAFSNCGLLTTVEIPSSVTHIGASAFSGCGGLSRVTMREGLASIGDNAFDGCRSLVSVTIPRSVNSIGLTPFLSCSNLREIVVEYGNQNYKSINGLLITNDGELISGINGDVTIPDGVSTIADRAFYDYSGLTSVMMPSSLRSVGEYAFAGCSSLVGVAIPEGVSRVGSYAFSNCAGLRTVTLPSSMRSIGSYAFKGCSGNLSVVVSEGVTNIDSYAFSGCTGLTSLKLPSSVVNIGASAFNGCGGLTSLVLPSSVTNIDNYAFAYCSGLRSVTIPDGVTRICDRAFRNCSELTEVTIPSSVNDIDQYAFEYCNKLITIIYDNLSVELLRKVLKTIPTTQHVCIVIPLDERIDKFWTLANAFENVDVRPANASGCVVHSGGALTNYNWTADSVHVVYGKNGVSDDLVIEPGTVVKFFPGAALVARDGCPLTAAGVVFTSVEDALVGTNCVVSLTDRQKTDWPFIVGIVDVDETTEFRNVRRDVLSGVLDEDVTLRSGLVYVVGGHLVVPAGIKLKIEPRAIVKCLPNTVFEVLAGGLCDVRGAIFTHIADDSIGGDTNEDVDSTKPEADAYAFVGEISDDDNTEYRYTSPIVTSGTIATDSVWRGHKVYKVTGNLTVAKGVTLTIQPGAILKFASGSSMIVNGILNAQGTRAAPIVFTSLKDDAWGGDTNGDGEKTVAQAGDWHQIYNKGNITMEHCQVLWCSAQNNQGALYPCGGTWLFKNSIVAHCQYDNMRSYGGTFTAENSLFLDGSMGAAPSSGTAKFVNCVFNNLTTAVRWGCGTFYNCVFSDIAQDIIDTKFYSSTLACQFHRCVFWNPASSGDHASAKVGQNGCVYADPLFTDPATWDFTVSPASPCVDAGDGTVAPATDYYGSPRMDVKKVKDTGVPNDDGVCPDIGIYEVPGTAVVPLPDLAVLLVTAPATARAGEEIAVVYMVTNRGAVAATGLVRDAVKFRGADAALGGQEVSAGEVEQAYALAAGAAASFTAHVTIPALKTGAWKVGVEVNGSRDVYEQNLANNGGWASATTEIALPGLTLGENTLTVEAGASVARALTGLPTAGGVVRVTGSDLDRLAVFGGNGAVPTAAANDSPGIRLDDGSWLVVLPKRGEGEDAYLAIDNGGSAATVQVTVEETKLALYGVAPKEIPNTGSAAVTITGSGLTADSAVTVGGRAATVEVLNAAQVLATFDATGLAVGAVPIVLTDGGKSATLNNALTVYKPKTGAKLEASLELPSSVRDGRIFTAYVVYANTGDEPMTLPLFKVESTTASTKLGLVASEAMSETKVFVGGISPTAPAGVLKPGESGRIPVFFQPFGTYRLKLTHVADTEKAGAFPAFGGVAAYKAAMSAAATRLNLRGKTAYNVHDFVDQATWEKNGVPCAAASGHLRDVRTKEPIADVTIALTTTNGAAATATTDANGYFQLTNLADGDYFWRVENGCTLADVSTNVVTVAAQADLNGCEVFATPGGRISGHVMGADGTVLAGATLVLSDAEGGQLAVTVSDDNGCFSFVGLSAGTNRVTCGAIDGYVGSSSADIALDAVNVRAQVEFELKRGATIRGTVTFAVNAVTNGCVQAITSEGVAVEVLCDDKGGYAFDGLPAGKYAVRYYSTNAYSEDVDVELAVGDAHEVDLTATERPLFVPTAKMGFGQLTAQFVFTDRSRMTNVIDWAWDFDSDGTVDSASDSPTWTYSKVGTNSVTLRITEYGGKVTESRYPDCCIVEEKLATVYKSNAVVFGYNSGTLAATAVEPETLTLTGDPATGTLVPGMVVMGNKGDDYFVRRVVSATKSGNVWTVTTEDADWSDVYEQYTESFVGEMETVAEPSVKSASSVKTRLKAASSSPVKIIAEGGVSFSISAQPDLRLEIVRKVQNGKKYERTALVGALKLGGSVALEGSVGVGWKKKQKLPFNIETPPFWGITVAPIAEVYAEAQASIKGELGVEGSVEGAIVVGMEKNGYEDAHWLPPLSFTPSGTVRANVEGNGHFKFGVNPGVKVSFIKTTDIKLALDGYAKFEVKAGTQTPAEVSLTAGVDLTGEVNLIDWELPWADVKVNIVSGTLEGPKAQYFRWTGPDPDFSWKPSGKLTSPCQIQLIDESTGDVIRWFGRQYEYSVKAHEWEFPDGGTIYSGMESAPYFSKDGKYRVGLHAIGNYVTGPCKKWKTVVVGKPEEEPDDGNQQQDDQGGGTPSKSCDPNEVAGPEGVGERRLVKPGEWLDYTIYFENKEGFDIADAQEVRVTNPLSEHLDWSTFEMGEIAFGGNTDLGLDGKREGTSEAAYNGTVRKVRTELTVDENGVASWYMRIVDPDGSFGWPEDGSGFLPSNDETHRGEGHLTYRIKVRDDAPMGVVITNSASIVFDYNDPIETDPAWWNTVGIPGVAFEKDALEVDEGGNVTLTVDGGNADKAASVQVYLAYQTAAAADLDLAKGTVDGVTPKGGIKFPLTLSWAAGDMSSKTITIPVKVDKTVEDDETLVFQLAAAQGQELGETTVCKVTIRDANVAADYAAKQAKETVKTKKDVETEALAVACVAGDGSGDVCGYTTGQGQYSKGSKVSLKATARPGWEFRGWGEVSEGVTNVVSDMPSWNVTLTNDAEIVAVFGRIPYVAGLALPADGGKVSGSGYCAAGKKVTLKATANKNFAFVGWYAAESGGQGLTALPTGEPVSRLPSLVLDRSAKPAKSDAKQTVITNVSASVTYYAVFKSDPTIFVYLDSDDNATAPGKVTGAGKYAAGKKKITLKATANKGYVFRGWYEGASVDLINDVPLTKSATYTLAEMPTNDVEYTAGFITVATDKANIVASVNGMAFPVRSGEDAASPLETNIWTGVYLEWPLAASALSETTVKVAGLPSGLKFTAKDVTQKIGSGKTAQTVVVVSANTIYGAPSAASKVDKSGKAAPSQVKVTVTTAGKSSQTYQIDTTVDPLPTWAVGTFTGPSYGGEATNGTVAVTIAASGKISAKQPVDGKAVSFAANYFDWYDVDEDAFWATLTAKNGTAVLTNEMVVSGHAGRVTLPAVGGGTPTLPNEVAVTNGVIEAERFDAWQYNWKAEPWKTLGKMFDKQAMTYAILSDGSYSSSDEDVASPLGETIVGKVTLKFATSGAVTVTGEFVSGYDTKKQKYMTVKATGSATLVPETSDNGLVFVYLTQKGIPIHTRCLEVSLTDVAK